MNDPFDREHPLSQYWRLGGADSSFVPPEANFRRGTPATRARAALELDSANQPKFVVLKPSQTAARLVERYQTGRPMARFVLGSTAGEFLGFPERNFPGLLDPQREGSRGNAHFVYKPCLLLNLGKIDNGWNFPCSLASQLLRRSGNWLGPAYFRRGQ